MLIRWALKLYPSSKCLLFSAKKKMGIGFHVTRRAVRDYKKSHPEVKSHKEALDYVIEDTKMRIAGCIAKGLYDKGCVDFTITKNSYVANVTGSVYLYGKEETTEA